MELFYYTTAETMKYILTGGDIFATHISYLNDSEEYINGLREMRDLLLDNESGYKQLAEVYLNDQCYESAIREIPQIYSISFSMEGDLLSQWYMYSKESGVRLKFDFGNRNVACKIKQKGLKERKAVTAELKDVHYFTRLGMEEQEYQEEKQRLFEIIQEYMDERINDVEGNLISVWRDVAPYIKNYEFRQEKEVRLIFNAQTAGTSADHTELIEYRSANGMLIPYLDVYMEKGWPIAEIMVGPGRNQARVFQSICHFLENETIKIPQIQQKAQSSLFINGLLKYHVSEKILRDVEKQVAQEVQISPQNISYQSAVYDILRNSDKSIAGEVNSYLERNYYSAKTGIIVRKSNAPYEFS